MFVDVFSTTFDVEFNVEQPENLTEHLNFDEPAPIVVVSSSGPRKRRSDDETTNNNHHAAERFVELTSDFVSLREDQLIFQTVETPMSTGALLKRCRTISKVESKVPVFPERTLPKKVTFSDIIEIFRCPMDEQSISARVSNGMIEVYLRNPLATRLAQMRDEVRLMA